MSRMNRHCIPGLTMSIVDGNFHGVSGILNRCTQGLARTRIVDEANAPGADTEETDVMI